MVSASPGVDGYIYVSSLDPLFFVESAIIYVYESTTIFTHMLSVCHIFVHMYIYIYIIYTSRRVVRCCSIHYYRVQK